jgi:Tol biopolymer transport system component
MRISNFIQSKLMVSAFALLPVIDIGIDTQLLMPQSQHTEAGQCYNLVDHGQTNPIKLSGKLAVTFTEESLDWDKEDIHELGTLDLSAPQSRIKRLTFNRTNESEVDISPDGNSITYTYRKKLDDFENNSEVWRINFDGTGATKIITGSFPAGAVWNHPNGDMMTFIRVNNAKPGELYLYDAKTKSIKTSRVAWNQKIIKGPEDVEVSYDNATMVFKLTLEGETAPSLYVMNMDGTNVRRITGNNPNARYSDHDPVFSRDNTKLYFERFYGKDDWFDCSGDRSMDKPECQWWGIVEVDIKTKAEKILMPYDHCGRHFYWLPTVSPDGKYLMFTHHDLLAEKEERPTSDLLVMTIDGKNIQKVPNSDWIYFFDWTK